MAAALKERKYAMRLGKRNIQTTTNYLGTSTLLSSVLSSLQYEQKRADWPKQQWPDQDAYARTLLLCVRNNKKRPLLSLLFWKQMEKVSQRCQEVRNQSEQDTAPVVRPQPQSSTTGTVSYVLQQTSHRAHEQPQIPLNSLQQNTLVSLAQDAL